MKKSYVLLFAVLVLGITLSCTDNNPRRKKWIV